MQTRQYNHKEAEAMQLIKNVALLQGDNKLISLGLSLLRQSYLPELVAEVNNVLKTELTLDCRNNESFQQDLAVISVKTQHNEEHLKWCRDRLNFIKSSIDDPDILADIKRIIESIIR